MKIAVIDPSLFTIPYDDALCDALAAQGCRPRLYGRRLRAGESRSGTTPLDPFFYGLVERLDGRLPRRAFRVLKGGEHAVDMLRLHRRLAALRPDIIHFQWAPLPIIDRIAVAHLRRVAPVLLTVHDTTPFNGSPNEAVQALGATSIFTAFDHLVVHTEAGKRQLAAHGLAAAQISVIPHGALHLPGGNPPLPSAEVGETVILAFGKIKPYKGTDLLIEAFAGLPEPLRARARPLGIADRIEWDLRYLRDAEIGGVIAAADILAFPYRQIDASGVLMAALSYGKPIVASAMGAFAELLRDGVHGRLVPPGDTKALGDALAELIADPPRRAAMGEAVRSIAGVVPDWPEIGRRTLALYESLLARRDAARGAALSYGRKYPRSGRYRPRRDSSPTVPR